MVKVKYNKELLEEICERDKCIIDLDKIETSTRELIIHFICKCGNEYNKKFRELHIGTGAFCEKCTLIIKKEKTEKTCLDKYGVKYSFQNSEVKDKIKETCLTKYGVEYYLQCDDIKEKEKQRYIDKHGIEPPIKIKKDITEDRSLKSAKYL